VDPLRAGHVAALEGRGFHYFCRAACKQEFLRASGRPQEEDVPTAAPPEVAYALEPANDANGPRTAPPSSVPSRATLPSVTRAPAVAAGEGQPEPPESPRSVPAVSGVRSSAVDPRAVFPSAPPDARPTLPSGRPAAVEKSPARRTPAAPSSPRRSDGATAVIDGLGVVAGVLAPAIGLLGAVADVARVPLVVFAWAALALRVQRSRRDPSDPHVLVVIAPAAAAVAAAWWAQAVGDPRAVAIAVFAGLACAVAIVVETTVGRSRERVHAEREAIERALDVRVRAVQSWSKGAGASLEVPSWPRGNAAPLELPGDDTIELPAADMRPGEPILVEAGEVVGVDGIVTGGEARVVPWLGARVEVARREGDPLVAGARVVSSRLRMTTTWSGRERAWVKLLSVPAARIDVAAPTARVLRHTVERGVPVAAILVGLATMANGARPVEVLAAMSAAAMAFGAKGLVSIVAIHFARAHLEALASGITYKDPRAFERAGSANIAVLSARGTVLLGEPEIVAVEPIGPGGAEAGDEEVARVLSLAAGAETGSTHPFAAAILRAARTRAARADDVRNATVHAGLGVTALASTGERLVVGGRAIMLAEKIGVAAVDGRVTELEGQGRSVLLVALGDRLVGLISLQDGLRAGARAAVQRLLDARIEPVLLSGEARDTCETIGRALDIEHVRPAVLPSDRGPEVRALGEGGSVIAVIGHPVSDDAALGAADVAVAMRAAGSTPGEWAVALASDDVRGAAMALAIPHATRARVRVAMALGAIPGLVALLAVGFGVAPLAIAPLAAFVGAVAVAVHARESV
jgi:Cu+-exporting ATPase